MREKERVDFDKHDLKFWPEYRRIYTHTYTWKERCSQSVRDTIARKKMMHSSVFHTVWCVLTSTAFALNVVHARGECEISAGCVLLSRLIWSLHLFRRETKSVYNNRRMGIVWVWRRGERLRRLRCSVFVMYLMKVFDKRARL